MKRRMRCLAVALLVGAYLLEAPAHAAAPGQVAAAPGDLAPVMLVLDASGSMRETAGGGRTKMTVAKRAIENMVEGLPEGSQLGLTVYGTGTGNSAAEKAAGCKDVKTLHEIGTDGQTLISSVKSLTPRGYTPIGEALKAAAATLPAEGPRSIVLVSDGEDTCAPPDPCDVARDLAKNGIELRVHAVGFDVDDKAKQQLTCVAQATQGSYTDATKAEELGSALNRVTNVALRNYEPTGAPIVGGADQQSAPLVKPGAYLDQLTPNVAKYYTIDVPAGYTAHFSASAIVPKTGYSAILKINRYAADGSDCHSYDSDIGGRGMPVSTAVSTWTVKAEEDSLCDKPGRFALRIERDKSLSKEITVPLELLVVLEPPATDPGPAAGEQVTFGEGAGGTAVQVTGGGSFTTAGTLDGSGTYTDTLAAGEYVFYRVRLGWGQGLAYRVRFPDNPATDGWSSVIGTQYFNPLREDITEGYHGNVYNGRASKLPEGKDALGTHPVRYANRTDNRLKDAAAGWYYIGVKYGSDTRPREGYPPAKIQLEVSVTGQTEAGPTYASGPVTEASPSQAPAEGAESTAPDPDQPAAGEDASGNDVFIPQDDQAERDDRTDAAAAGAEDGGMWQTVSDAGPLVWAGGPALLLVLLLVLAFMIRRRPKPAPVIPMPHAPQQPRYGPPPGHHPGPQQGPYPRGPHQQAPYQQGPYQQAPYQQGPPPGQDRTTPLPPHHQGPPQG